MMAGTGWGRQGQAGWWGISSALCYHDRPVLSANPPSGRYKIPQLGERHQNVYKKYKNMSAFDMTIFGKVSHCGATCCMTRMAAMSTGHELSSV